MSAVDTTFESPAPEAARTPVRARDRIVLLDVLRGLAILGILAVNAMAFAWPFEIFMSPEAAPFLDGGVASPDNALATWVVNVFFENKMRTLFAMLFGVSIFLVGGERSDAGRGKLLRSRLFWMAVFGLIHGLGLWFGDILLTYAWSGVFMMLLRSWPAGRLLWVGIGVTVAFALMQAGGSWFMANAPAEFAAQMEAGNSMTATAADVQAAVEIYRSSWAGAWTSNAMAWAIAFGFSALTLPFVLVPMMMIGLGLYKSGFFLGRSPAWVYGLCVVLAGVNLAALGYWTSLELAAPVKDNPSGGLAGVAGSFAPLISVGYASVLILMTTKGLGFITRILAPVGRMAFTNYLTQTLIMTSLFYMPWGPLWFGQVTPAGLWPIVGAIWVTQLIWSPLWLWRFEMGPLEWLWRCLTYGRMVPLLKRG